MVVDLGAGACQEQRPLLCPLGCEADGVQKSFSLCPKPMLMGIFVAVSYPPLQHFVVLWKLQKTLFSTASVYPLQWSQK